MNFRNFAVRPITKNAISGLELPPKLIKIILDFPSTCTYYIAGGSPQFPRKIFMERRRRWKFYKRLRLMNSPRPTENLITNRFPNNTSKSPGGMQLMRADRWTERISLRTHLIDCPRELFILGWGHVTAFPSYEGGYVLLLKISRVLSLENDPFHKRQNGPPELRYQ